MSITNFWPMFPLYPLKTPENLSNIGQKWVKCNLKDINEVLRYCRQILLVMLSQFKWINFCPPLEVFYKITSSWKFHNVRRKISVLETL